MMTPYELGILLWYYAHAEDHPDMFRQPPVWPETIDRFQADKLLEFIPEDNRPASFPMAYELTERGHVYINSLLDVPLPVQVWVTPERTK